MGRTLDLPSVIELAPCKYKRVYFYFGVQKKLIFIYSFLFCGADLTGNRITGPNMARNKIKQDFHFTTLKRFKIIKLTNS